jgi:hypothetical protein
MGNIYPRSLLTATAIVSWRRPKQEPHPPHDEWTRTAEIWIKHDGGMNSKRVSLDLGSNDGTVRAIVVRISLSILVSSSVFKAGDGGKIH